jgi:transposase
MPRADVPRIGCAEHGVLQATTPWSKPGSRFPALLEAVVIDWPNESAESMHAGIQRIKRMACR